MSEPLTDEVIDNVVKLVEAAEVMAKTMNMPVSQALRFMMKATQVYAQLQQKGLDISHLVSQSRKPS